MQRLFIMLNKLPFVTRYAWYADDCWSNRACRDSSLFTSAGRLTAAGLEFENLASAGAL
jgi:hypothetical protein